MKCLGQSSQLVNFNPRLPHYTATFLQAMANLALKCINCYTYLDYTARYYGVKTSVGLLGAYTDVHGTGAVFLAKCYTRMLAFSFVTRRGKAKAPTQRRHTPLPV